MHTRRKKEQLKGPGGMVKRAYGGGARSLLPAAHVTLAVTPTSYVRMKSGHGDAGYGLGANFDVRFAMSQEDGLPK